MTAVWTAAAFKRKKVFRCFECTLGVTWQARGGPTAKGSGVGGGGITSTTEGGTAWATKGGMESEDWRDGPHTDGKSCGTQVEKKTRMDGGGKREEWRGETADSKSAFHLSSPLVAREHLKWHTNLSQWQIKVHEWYFPKARWVAALHFTLGGNGKCGFKHQTEHGGTPENCVVTAPRQKKQKQNKKKTARTGASACGLVRVHTRYVQAVMSIGSDGLCAGREGKKKIKLLSSL